ncbi:MAG: hypothetical protein WC378_13225 [Opitutaceae bacterium]
MNNVLQDAASKFSSLDYLVIGLYMLGTLGIGLYFKRSSGKSMEDFFLGGRRLPGWANGFSLAAACLNSDVAPAYIAWTAGTGLFVCWLYISRFGLALMVGGILFAIFWRKLNLFTSPEFYEMRFPGRIGSLIHIWIAIRSAFIAIVAWSGVGLLGMSKVTEPVFGWSKVQTIVIIVPAVLLYVFTSGYLGVVFTDVFQSLVMIIAGCVLCGFIVYDFHGPAALLKSAVAGGGTEMMNSFPPLDHGELGLVAVIAWFIGTGIGYGGDVAPMSGAMEGQRIFSCRNGREAAKMYIWTEIVLFVLLLTVTLPGLAAVARWPEYHTATRAVRETAFGNLIVTYMPHGLLGLQIAALMAALMSTLSANFNFGAQVVTNDVYKRFMRPQCTDKHYLFVGRMVLFLICGLSVIVALKAESLITVAIFMLGLSSAEYAANWAQWWWWRFNSYSRLAASLGGPLIFLLVRFALAPLLSAHGGPLLSEWYQVLVSIALTTVLWTVVTLLTPPQDEKILMDFYRRAQPLGFWGPIREKLGIKETRQDKTLIATGFGLAVLGTVWIGAVVLGLSNLFVGLYWKMLGFGAVAAVGGWFFFRAFQRFMETLMARSHVEECEESQSAGEQLSPK